MSLPASRELRACRGSELTVTGPDHPALPPIAVLIVDDHGSSARQLARLLQLWGAGQVTTATTLAAAIRVLEQHQAPLLVLVESGPGSITSPALALWVAARSAIRKQTVVAAYTSADQSELKRRLSHFLELLCDQPKHRHQVFGMLAETHHAAAELLRLCERGGEGCEAVHALVYDAHLSKHLTIDELRGALQPLAECVALLE